MENEEDPRESEGDKHTNRVLGGYKVRSYNFISKLVLKPNTSSQAALKNPNVSEEAKDNAEDVLKDHGAI